MRVRLALVVDDSAVNRIYATAALQSISIEVLEAEDGETALAILAGSQVDLILMDCEMPAMNGYETTCRIRERELLMGLPRTIIIAATTRSSQEDIDQSIAAGMDAHLTKPYTVEQLEAVIWSAQRR